MRATRAVRGWAPTESLPAVDPVTGAPMNMYLGERSRWAVQAVRALPQPPQPPKREGPNPNLSKRSQWAVELVLAKEAAQAGPGASSFA